MAYTERYVTSAAAGGGDGSSGSPWTFAEAVANAVAGDRVNIQSDGAYSIGATTFSAGTHAANICWRGYNSTIGDLDTVGRDTPANGSGLITTNMPEITITSQWQGAAHNSFMNLNFTGSIASSLITGASLDRCSFYQCSFTNTANNASANCLNTDDACRIVMCDFECSGAAHFAVVTGDSNVLMFACKIKGVSTSSALCSIQNGAAIVGNLFIGGGEGIVLEAAMNGEFHVINNTAYNLGGEFIQLPNAASNNNLTAINNHVTDSAQFIDNTYSATASVAAFLFNNRTRDNTSADNGLGDGIDVGGVTTDTGGAETDYTAAGSDDFSLISGAPGEDTGINIG